MAEIPENVRRAAREADEALDELINTYDDELLKVARDLDNDILEMISEMDINNGEFQRNQRNMNRLLSIRADVAEAIEERYGALSQQWVDNFDEVAVLATSTLGTVGIDATLSAVDRDMIEALRRVSFSQLTNTGIFATDEISREITQQVIVGGRFRDLRDTIRGKLAAELLAEGASTAGTTLNTTSQRIAHDSLMSVYRTTHKVKGEEAGVTRWLYFGGTVADTRDFCLARVNRQFTKEEIDSWNDMTWQGKITGSDVWQTLGGYFCRHHLQPVP